MGRGWEREGGGEGEGERENRRNANDKLKIDTRGEDRRVGSVIG